MPFSSPDYEQALAALATDQLSAAPPNLRESILYSLLAPGKRIRPRIACATGELLGLPAAVYLRTGISLEMIHCFSLIHDDLPCLDNDDFRRGRPSNHKVHGEALALLAGDALVLQAASALLSLPGVSAERVNAGTARLLRLAGPAGMIGGQAAEGLLNDRSTLDQVRAMQALKTGALFEASVMIPADLAGVAEDSASGHALKTFSQALGWAFQVADDLADGTQDGSREEVNVLSRISPAEAREMAHRELGNGRRALQEIWPETSAALLKIADEVGQLIERTAEGN
jgi:geranylgeranyl diphosphate synthase, type II